MTRVCAHMTPGQRKAGPWLDGGVLSVWVPVANQSSATHVEQWNDTTARQRSARGDDGSGTCKRPARLDGQLSSVGGSAWWREQAAGNTPSASSHGSVQPRLEGWVHNKVKGGDSPCVPGHDGEAAVSRCGGEADVEQRMQNRARCGTARLEAGEQHGEEEAGGSARRRGGRWRLEQLRLLRGPRTGVPRQAALPAGRAATRWSSGATASGSSMGGRRRRRAAPGSSTDDLP
jgi:hypothetical protein